MSETTAYKTRRELEMQIGRAVIHFEKEFMGRGPLETKAYLLDDLVLVRLKGVLTPAERKLAESQSNRSSYLLKQVRNELLSSGRPMLEAVVRDILGVSVQSVHTDISTKTGERIIVMTLQQKPEYAAEAGDQARAEQDPVLAADEASLDCNPGGQRRDGIRRPAFR